MSLLQIESLLLPEWVTVQTDAGPVQVILFSVHPGWPLYSVEPSEEELTDILSSAVGDACTMAEFLLNTVNALEKAGVHDAHLWHLQELAAIRPALLQAGAITAPDPTNHGNFPVPEKLPRPWRIYPGPSTCPCRDWPRSGLGQFAPGSTLRWRDVTVSRLVRFT